MTALGQVQTNVMGRKLVRFRGTSSRPMSALTAEGDFMPRLPAHPLRADATADPSFGRLIARTSHSDAVGWTGRSNRQCDVVVSLYHLRSIG